MKLSKVVQALIMASLATVTLASCGSSDNRDSFSFSNGIEMKIEVPQGWAAYENSDKSQVIVVPDQYKDWNDAMRSNDAIQIQERECSSNSVNNSTKDDPQWIIAMDKKVSAVERETNDMSQKSLPPNQWQKMSAMSKEVGSGSECTSLAMGSLSVRDAKSKSQAEGEFSTQVDIIMQDIASGNIAELKF